MPQVFKRNHLNRGVTVRGHAGQSAGFISAGSFRVSSSTELLVCPAAKNEQIQVVFFFLRAFEAPGGSDTQTHSGVIKLIPGRVLAAATHGKMRLFLSLM